MAVGAARRSLQRMLDQAEMQTHRVRGIALGGQRQCLRALRQRQRAHDLAYRDQALRNAAVPNPSTRRISSAFTRAAPAARRGGPLSKLLLA